MSKISRALFSTPVTPRKDEEEHSPSQDSSFSESLSTSTWRTRAPRRDEATVEQLTEELRACYKMLKEERRITNEYHKRVHGSPSEWGKRVSKRLMELHPLYSPGSAEKRPRVISNLDLDEAESLLREEVLASIAEKSLQCACGAGISLGDMAAWHVLPCPHCGCQKCSECAALALEIRAKSSCCESCANACSSCVRKLRLGCSACHLGRRCQGAGCGGSRCSTCFNQLCEDCKELDDNGNHVCETDGFEFFFCSICQFRSCQDCQRKNCYCAPATRQRVPDAIPTKVEGRSMSYLFDVLGGKHQTSRK